MGRSLAREKLMFKTCLRLSVSALRNYCYRHGSFLVVSCVVFLGRFFITTEASYNTLKVAPDLRQLRTSCRLLLETCTATLSENCEIWHVYRYSWETSCAQIGRCHAKSGGSYKGWKVGPFHTFLESAKFHSYAEKGRRDIVVERRALRRRGKQGKKNVLYGTPPARRFRSAASCSLQMATYPIAVEKVTSEGSYSAKSVFSFSRMRNAELVFCGCRGAFNTFRIL